MKQTEVGLIPDDWDVKKLDELGAFLGGGTPSTQNANYWKGTIPWISSSDINKDDINFLYPTRFITKEAINSSATQLCPKNTILIVSRVGVGKLAISEKEVCTSQDFANFIPQQGASLFLAYSLLPIMQRKACESQGTSIKGITVDEIKQIQIAIPPIEEQQRIAKALSVVDALIITTEKLIQKKKNIKQGVMQNLLTGKKRLPGFAKSTEYKQTELGLIPEDWEVKSLGEIGEPCMCKRILKEQTFPTGDVPFYKIGTFGGIPDAFISYELFEEYKEKYNYPKIGTLLLSAAGTIGRVVVFDGKDSYFQDSNIVWIENDENKVTNKFLYYCYKRMQWKTEEGGIVSRLYNSNLKQTSFIAPKMIDEQNAIANVLSSMDKEIETLNTKLEKYRNLKTAMMQQLLTGKIRLAK